MKVMSPLQSVTGTGGAAAAQPRDITMPFIALDRLRMETDGDGVTTLVASKGCPLSCRYQSENPLRRRSEPADHAAGIARQGENR